ncbi:hypothetical protein ACFYOK_20355 [Microbispora bryophytorum]|uniref:hypothetical protein n=1 Tax=Microbispora bryophytorum TaxID=1460882 RepID=UPI0033C835C5
MVTTALTAAVTSVATLVVTAVATPFSNRLQSLIEQAPVTPLITVPVSVGALVSICCYPLWRGKVMTSGRWAAAVAAVVLWPLRRIQWPQGLRSWAGRMLVPLAVGYIAACLGAFAGLVGLVVVRAVAPPGACEPPRELRVITALENVTALRERAEAYTKEQRTDGCAPVRIAVGVAPTIEEMRYGFRNEWLRDDALQNDEPYRRMLGLTPDAWIPTGSAEFDLVVQDVSEKGGEETGNGGVPEKAGSLSSLLRKRNEQVGTDHMSIAVFGAAKNDLLTSELESAGYPLAGIVERARSKDMSLVYPQPAFSTSGAIVATTLSRAGPRSGDTALRATFDNSANALLCHLRGAGQEGADEGRADDDWADEGGTDEGGTDEDWADEDWARLVALVPSHSADEYNRGSDMGIEGCAHNPLAGRAALTAVSSVDLPTLDYPFVEIDWSEDPARREALDAFATWLAHNKLFEPAGEGPQPSSPARISADAARPGHRVDLQMMIDGSGSMARSPTASASALHDALAEVRQILTDTDQVSAGKFFADDRGSAKAPMAREGDAGGGQGPRGYGDILQWIADDTQSGFDEPISTLIGGLSRPANSLAVITDGGPFNDEPGPGDAGRSIRRALEAAADVSNLYILTFGGKCPDGLETPRAVRPSVSASPPGEPPGSSEPVAKHVVCDDAAGTDVAGALGRMIFQFREWS